MKTRIIYSGIGLIVVLIAIYLIFATLPSKETASKIAPPTVNPSEKMSGGNIEGQILFSRGGMLWAWHGDSATRLAIEAGSSVIANSKVTLSQPSLNASGSAIAYIRQDESYSDLFVVNSDGTKNRQLTHFKGQGVPRSDQFVESSLWAFDPAWSPDGSSLAFLSDTGTDDLTLWVSGVNNFSPKRVATTGLGQGGIGRFCWLSDGTRIIATAFENGKPQIYRLNLQTGNSLKLTDLAEGALDPAVSPDGQTIMYVVNKGSSTELWSMDIEGSNQKQVSNLPARTPVWSPDGGKIAFLATKGGGFDLFTLRIENGTPLDLQQISHDANIDATGGLSWGR